MNNRVIGNINPHTLDRMLWEYENSLPMTTRERLAIEEVHRLTEELKDKHEKKTVAKNKSRTSGDS